MPTPITDADKIYVRELLIKVIKQSGISLTSTKSYKQLQKQIQESTNENLSISTLKRLFGNSSTKPTQVILNICAAFTGFTSWQHYLADARQSDKYLLQHEVSLVIVTQKINIDNIYSICSKYGHLKEIQSFLFCIIRLAAEQQNKDFFKVVFTLPNIFSKKFHTEYDCYYLGQSVALALRSNPSLAKQLTGIYVSNANAVQYCIESFVDEDYFKDYYEHWLRHYIHKKATSEALTFYYCLQYFNAIQNKKSRLAKGIYQKLKALNPTRLSKIVEARYFAILLIHEKHIANAKQSNVYSRIMQLAKKQNGFYIDYEMYLLRYLFVANKFDVMCIVSDLFGKYNAQTNEHWLQKSHNLLLLYKSLIHYVQGNVTIAITTFQKVNTNLFDPFMYYSSLQHYNQIKAIIFEQAI